MTQSAWWNAPRNIYVVVDNPSWVLPYAERLVMTLKQKGDLATLCRTHAQIGKNGVAIYLGCVKITPEEILKKNFRNLVVHASNLPDGKGFSPWAWLTLAGETEIPICLIEAVKDVDAGPVIYRDEMVFEGHELVDELRDAIGEKTIELCHRFLDEETIPLGAPQIGEGQTYSRRYPKDSEIDPQKTLAEQFNLLRIVDNDNYPAFFEHMGHRYKLSIVKSD